MIGNYGHGGSGVTLAWGCAEDVANLVNSILGATHGPQLLAANSKRRRAATCIQANSTSAGSDECLPIAYPEDTLVTIRPGDATTGSPPLQLHVRTYGDPRNPALLVVNGIGAPKEGQPERALYQPLASAGYFVVSFSNRDTGGSTRMDHAGQVSIVSTLALSALSSLLPPAVLSFAVAVLGYHASRKQTMKKLTPAPLLTVVSLAVYALYTVLLGGGRAFTVTPPYELSEVAEDAVLLMDAMSISRAHVMGTSMGGMLAQTLVLQYPHRFLSLASCYSDTGKTTAIGLPAYPLSTLFRLYVRPIFLRPEPGDTEGNIAYEMDVLRFQKPDADTATWNGGEKDLRAFARGRMSLQKKWDTPESRGRAFGRQMASIAWQDGGGRDSALSACRVPLSSSMGWTISLSRWSWLAHGPLSRREKLQESCAGAGLWSYHGRQARTAHRRCCRENCRFADNLQAQDGAAGAAGSRSSMGARFSLEWRSVVTYKAHKMIRLSKYTPCF